MLVFDVVTVHVYVLEYVQVGVLDIHLTAIALLQYLSARSLDLPFVRADDNDHEITIQ